MKTQQPWGEQSRLGGCWLFSRCVACVCKPECFAATDKRAAGDVLCSKTRGMGAGRKLSVHRREERWADKDFNKSHLGSEWKKPFAGASHAKGIVLEKM